LYAYVAAQTVFYISSIEKKKYYINLGKRKGNKYYKIDFSVKGFENN
jgi:hypothetical protein